MFLLTCFNCLRGITAAAVVGRWCSGGSSAQVRDDQSRGGRGAQMSARHSTGGGRPRRRGGGGLDKVPPGGRGGAPRRVQTLYARCQEIRAAN